MVLSPAEAAAMPGFVFRRIDPDEETLLAALDAAFERTLQAESERQGTTLAPPAAGPAPQALPERAERDPQGIHVWRWPSNNLDSHGIVAAWWTDVLGRRHWLVEGPWSGGPVPYRQGSYLDTSDEWHPLELIYPDRPGCWREREGRPDWLVLCGCGACGTVEQIAWTGECCGPCFDRRLDEGIAPPEPGPTLTEGRPLDCTFDQDGRLLVLLDIGGEERVAAWAPPEWCGAPAWQRELWPHAEETPFRWKGLACRGPTVAVAGLDGLAILDSRDGRILARSQSNVFSNLFHLAFAGPEGDLLVGLGWGADIPFSATFDLHVWEWRRLPAAGASRYRSRSDGECFGIGAAGRELFLARGGEVIECRDAETGNLLRRYRLPGVSTLRALAVTPDQRLLAAGCRPDGTGRLARWEPAAPAPPGTLLGRLASLVIGPAAQEPSVVRSLPDHYDPALTLSPDGRLLVTKRRRGLAFHDVSSLEERANAVWDLADVVAHAFSPDGQTLAVATSRWIALWPVRCLLGD
jgi:hypothetical protein